MWACVRARARACACVRARARVCERLHVRALVGACRVFALTGHMRAHAKLCICLCMHVRAGVGAHACAYGGVGQRACGLCVCVRACEFMCVYDHDIMLLCVQARCVRTSVRTGMYVRACECRPMCGRVCVHECAREGCSCARMYVH